MSNTMFGAPPSKVDHPSHYNMGSIEVIDAIEDWGLNFSLGNAVKYIARAQYKGAMKEDLEKAIWYLQREIDMLDTDTDKGDDAGDNG